MACHSKCRTRLCFDEAEKSETGEEKMSNEIWNDNSVQDPNKIENTFMGKRWTCFGFRFLYSIKSGIGRNIWIDCSLSASHSAASVSTDNFGIIIFLLEWNQLFATNSEEKSFFDGFWWLFFSYISSGFQLFIALPITFYAIVLFWKIETKTHLHCVCWNGVDGPMYFRPLIWNGSAVLGEKSTEIYFRSLTGSQHALRTLFNVRKRVVIKRIFFLCGSAP